MMQYGNWTLEETKALLNIFGGQEEARAALRGEKRVVIEDVLPKFFDEKGRRIPPRNLKLARETRNPNRNYYLIQPEIDYADRLARLKTHFQEQDISVDDFQSKAKQLLEQLKQDEHLSNLLKGVYLPICLPKLNVSDFDYGRVLEQVFLSAVERACMSQFPDGKFENKLKGRLADQVTVMGGNQHFQQVVIKMMKSQIVGIYFPNPLQGFSIDASREQMASLPEGLFLAGGFDTITAIVMYPDALAREWRTPGLYLAALSYPYKGTLSLYFLVYGINYFIFSDVDVGPGGFAEPDDCSCFSAGLLFLGKP